MAKKQTEVKQPLLGDTVLWFPQASRTAQPVVALVTAVIQGGGLALSLFYQNREGIVCKDNVHHLDYLQDDKSPAFTKTAEFRSRHGGWEHRDVYYAQVQQKKDAAEQRRRAAAAEQEKKHKEMLEKSQLVIDMIESDPTLSPAEIAASLREKTQLPFTTDSVSDVLREHMNSAV